MTQSPRPATESDLGTLEALEKNSHPKSGWTRSMFSEELGRADSLFWVMTDNETDEKVSAYLVARRVDRDLHLLNLVVDIEHRGLGLAKKMLNHLVTEGLKSDVQRVFLEVRKSNAAAVNLYQNQGFSISSVRRAQYSDGEDAYFMELPLQGGERIRI